MTTILTAVYNPTGGGTDPVTHPETATTDVATTVEKLDAVLWIVDPEPEDPHKVQEASGTEHPNATNHLGGVQK